MDTSEKYIKMCEKAQEIQQLRSSHRDWEDQDFCLEIDENGCYDIESSNAENFGLFRKSTKDKGVIFLPRQDQLQEIAKDDLKHIFINPLGTLLNSFNEFINKSGYSICVISTLEQLWLAFIMEEKYDKTWNEEVQDWESI